MPGLLNSCWLVLAFCAVVHHLRSTHPLPSLRLQRALALICALALLFPVISADDDLLQQQMASEDNTCFRMIKASADPHKCKVRLGSALVAVIVMPVLMHTVDDTADFVPPVYRTLKSQTTGDRSPPQF
jgi:hypothetical protein